MRHLVDGDGDMFEKGFETPSKKYGTEHEKMDELNTEKWKELRHWLQGLMLNTNGSAYLVLCDVLEEMDRLDKVGV